MVRVGEHYRPIADRYSPGVYRVVGTADDVTLLRITTVDGRRVSTGELCHVSLHILQTEFEFTENPDPGLTSVWGVRNALSGLYWQVRKLF